MDCSIGREPGAVGGAVLAVVDHLDSTDSKIAAEEKVVGGLFETKSALMSVLFTGELRVKVDENQEYQEESS